MPEWKIKVNGVEFSADYGDFDIFEVNDLLSSAIDQAIFEYTIEHNFPVTSLEVIRVNRE
jgi:hypothetical protein